MINNKLDILYVTEQGYPQIDVESYRKEFLNHGAIDASIEILFETYTPAGIGDFTSVIASLKPDLYIFCLNKKTEDSLTTLCELAWNLDPQAQIIIFQNDDENYEEMCKKLWALGIREFLCNSMSRFETVARLSKAISEYLLLKKYQNLSKRLHEISLVDSLTGLSNMRHFYIQYKNLIDRVSASDKSLAVFMIDLDKFKTVNDSNSHLFGSYVLSQVGRLMSHASMIPEDSLLARYGGDEFIWAIGCRDINEAMQIAIRWLKLLKSSVFHKDEFSAAITASIGVAFVSEAYKGHYDFPMKVADYMLYRSKRMGRNQAQGIAVKDATAGLDCLRETDILIEDNNPRRKPA